MGNAGEEVPPLVAPLVLLVAAPVPKPDHPDAVVAPLLLLLLVVEGVVELDAEEAGVLPVLP